MITLITSQKNMYDDNSVDVLGITHNIKTTHEFDNLNEYLQNTKLVALDTETTGLSLYEDKPITLQIGDEDNIFIIDLRNITIPKDTIKLIENKYIKKIGINIKFDYNMLKNVGLIIDNLECIMVNENLLNAGKYTEKDNKFYKQMNGFGRYTMAGIYFNYYKKSIDKETTESFLHIGALPFYNKQIQYMAQDIIVPCRIKEKQDKLLATEGFRHKFKLHKYNIDICEFEGMVGQALGDIEYNGMPLNTKKWSNIAKIFEQKALEIKEKMNKIVVESKKMRIRQLSVFEQYYTGINWNSSIQKLKIIKEMYNKVPIDKHGTASTSKEALQELNLPLTNLLIEYSNARKQASTYGDKFIEKHLDKDSRIRTSFWQICSTGRVSSNNPNIQNIPRLKEVRECFEALHKYLISTNDYSGQELRITADKCRCPILKDFFINGDGDSHSLLANKLFEIIEGKKQNPPISSKNKGWSDKFNNTKRGIAKNLNFKLNYGGSTYTVSQSLGISMSDAQVLYDATMNAFPVKKAYYEYEIEKALNQGYILINNITKRKRYLANYEKYKEYVEAQDYGDRMTKTQWKAYKKMEGSYSRLAMNTPIQGTAGDMTKAALVLIRLKLIENNVKPLHSADIKLISVVHDETVVEFRKELKELATTIQKDAMLEAGNMFCETIPIIAEPEVLQCWTK